MLPYLTFLICDSRSRIKYQALMNPSYRLIPSNFSTSLRIRSINWRSSRSRVRLRSPKEMVVCTA
jgi:hypothetical protein